MELQVVGKLKNCANRHIGMLQDKFSAMLQSRAKNRMIDVRLRFFY